MTLTRVLVIEDDLAIRRGLCAALASQGFAALEAGDGAAGLGLLRRDAVDLVLLDLVLPGADGLDVLREIRAHDPALPVIILTARGSEDNRVKGLSSGADDYVVKPFSVRELLARVESVLRRSPERTGRAPRVAALPLPGWPGAEVDLLRGPAALRGRSGAPAPAGREKAAFPLDLLADAVACATALPEPPPAARRRRPARPAPSPAPPPEPETPLLLNPGDLTQQILQQAPGFQLQEAQQILSNSNEFQMRSNIRSQQVALVPPPRRDDSAPPLRIETLLEPAWAGDGLYLVRPVRREGGPVRWQGVEVDWPLLRGFLLDGVRDLLPAADLRPAVPGAAVDPGRRLALLPVELVPGATTPPPAAWTPLRINLALSFGVIALVVVATAGLFAASLRQSRRRADFVSAVTHELRTPLTTFRLYADLLAEDRVPREEHGSYLATLRDEAERLGHLVDNVLAYSRLERQPGRERIETLRLDDLLARVLPGLEAGAARAGLAAVSSAPSTARPRKPPDRHPGWGSACRSAAASRGASAAIFDWFRKRGRPVRSSSSGCGRSEVGGAMACALLSRLPLRFTAPSDRSVGSDRSDGSVRCNG